MLNNVFKQQISRDLLGSSLHGNGEGLVAI